MSPFSARHSRLMPPSRKRSRFHSFEALEQRSVLSSAPLAVVDFNAVLAGQTLLAGTPPDQPDEMIVAPGSTWRYFATGRSPGATWMQPSFPDDTWSSGRAELGYGDGDEATVVPYGPDPLSRYLTTYLRHEFDVTDPGSFSILTLGVLRDDGAIVYLNGTEVARDNVSIASWWARATTDQNDNDSFLQFSVSPQLLVSGRNVLAVELHQSSPTSSDLSFDLMLSGRQNADWVSQGVLSNDSDPDGDLLMATLAAAPRHGTVVLYPNGAYAYTPQPGYLGPDAFTYRASDGTSSSTATVTIDVRTQHYAPQAAGDTYHTLVGQTLAVTARSTSDPAPRLFQSTADSTLADLLNNQNVYAFPYDASSDEIFAVRFYVAEPTRTASIGTIMRGTNVSSNSAASGFLALVALIGPEDVPDSLDLSTPDVLGAAVVPLSMRSEIISAAIEVNLTPGWYAVAMGSNHFGATANWQFPVWRGDPIADYAARQRIGMFSEDHGWAATPYIPHVFVVDAPFQVGILANDTDANSDVLMAQLVGPPAVGNLDLHSDGTFSYVPPLGFEGTTTFRYQVADPWLTSEIATATIVVSNSPPVPVVTSDVYVLDEDSALEIGASEGVLASDIPANLTSELINPPKNGTLLLAADGSLRYQPAADFFGSDRFLYRARQGDIASGPVEVTLSVSPQPDGPTIQEDDYRTTVDQPLRAGQGARPATHLYWADAFTRRIRRQDLVTGETEDVLTNLPQYANVFAIDPVHEMVYWAYASRIYYAPFFGTSQILIRESFFWDTCRCGEPTISDIFLDVPNGDIYYAGHERTSVSGGWSFLWRASLDGPDGVPPWGLEVTPFLAIQPAGLLAFRFELDLKAGHIYMVDYDTSSVRRSNLDGTGLTTILTNRSGLEDIALDVDGGKLYIRRNGIGIERANLDGTGLELFAPLEEWDAFGHTMTFDGVAHRLIWTPTGYEIASADRIDGIASTLVGDNLLYVNDLVLDQVYSQNHTFGVLANDRDPDREPLMAILESGPAHGNVSLASDGTFEYVPDAGFVGVDEFTYRAHDGSVASGISTVRIRVIGRLPGDLNLDGLVNRFDVAVFATQLGRPSGAERRDGDFDGDGDVDMADFAALQRNFTPIVVASPSGEIASALPRGIGEASPVSQRPVLRATRRGAAHEQNRATALSAADAALASSVTWHAPRARAKVRR